MLTAVHQTESLPYGIFSRLIIYITIDRQIFFYPFNIILNSATL